MDEVREVVSVLEVEAYVESWSEESSTSMVRSGSSTGTAGGLEVAITEIE